MFVAGKMRPDRKSSVLLAGLTAQVLSSSCGVDLFFQLTVLRRRSQDAKTGKKLKERLQKFSCDCQQFRKFVDTILHGRSETCELSHSTLFTRLSC